jgi:hypothetical protein
VVLACSLKLIWCCLVPSVCSDSDEGYAYTTTLLGGSKWKSRYLLKWSARTVPKRAVLTGVFENVFPGSHI